jgi:hypothetical protein
MAETQKTPEESKVELTLADAARLAKKPLKDCLEFKDYGDVVVVVTVNGEKITVAKNAKV